MKHIGICDIELSQYSSTDPIGRVFFFEDRIFRAISPDYEKQVCDFLSSPLYHELRQKNLFVETWIANDIHLEGYNLILEAKKLRFIPWRYWSIAQMRDAALKTLEIYAIVCRYSYYLKDANYDNFAIDNGGLCFIDIGSFIKDYDDFFCESFAVNIYSTLHHASKGEIYLARHIGNTHGNNVPYIPSLPVEISLSQKEALHCMVRYYDAYLRPQ